MNPEPEPDIRNHWSHNPEAVARFDKQDFDRVDYPLDYYRRSGGFTEDDVPSDEYIVELVAKYLARD